MRRILSVIALLALSGCGSFQGLYSGQVTVSQPNGGPAQNFSVTGLQLIQSGTQVTGTLQLNPIASSTPGAAPGQPFQESISGTSNGNFINPVTVTSTSQGTMYSCTQPMTGMLTMTGNQLNGTFSCSQPIFTQSISLNKIN